MKPIKLTATFAERVLPGLIRKMRREGLRQRTYWDASCPAFGCAISIAKSHVSASYVCRSRDETGSSRSKTIGSVYEVRSKDARARAGILMSDIESGDCEDSGLTLKKALELYITQKSKRGVLGQRSVEDYSYRIKKWLGRWLHKDMSAITKKMIRDKFDDLSALDPTTANRTFKVLGAIYNEHDLTNPVSRYLRGRWHPYVPKDLDERVELDLPKIFDLISSYRDTTLKNAALLMLFTGLRLGEVQKRRWDDIREEHRTLHMPTTKNGKPHTLPLEKVHFDILTEQKRIRDCFPAGDIRAEYVFPSTCRGSHKGYFNAIVKLWHHVEKGDKKRKIDGLGYRVTSHDMRRIFATWCDVLGVAESRIAFLLNHAAPNQTRRYKSIKVEMVREDMATYCDGLMQLFRQKSEVKRLRVVS